jgi:hypothetical protein
LFYDKGDPWYNHKQFAPKKMLLDELAKIVTLDGGLLDRREITGAEIQEILDTGEPQEWLNENFARLRAEFMQEWAELLIYRYNHPKLKLTKEQIKSVAEVWLQKGRLYNGNGKTWLATILRKHLTKSPKTRTNVTLEPYDRIGKST